MLELRQPDVLVLGTGRSGTSFTAFVLGTALKVCMGIPRPKAIQKCDFDNYKELMQRLQPKRDKTKHRLGTAWESMIKPSWAVVNKEITPRNWLITFNSIHVHCVSNTKYIGVKTPILLWVPADFWDTVKPRIIINAIRTKEQVFNSNKKWGKKLGWNDEKWGIYEEIRDDVLSNLPGYIELDFSVERDIQYVVDRIKPLLES